MAADEVGCWVVINIGPVHLQNIRAIRREGSTSTSTYLHKAPAAKPVDEGDGFGIA